MPSRCAFESRPLRELPTTFLCAINIPFLNSIIQIAELLNDRVDSHGCVALAMTLFALVLFATLEFEYNNFVRASVSEHGSLYLLIQHRRADLHFRSVRDSESVELNVLTDLSGYTRHAHDLAFGNAELFSTGFNNCVSHGV